MSGQWMPIERAWEERESDETLLLYVPGTGVTVGHLSEGEFVIDVLNDCRETYATHFMPLPPPPLDHLKVVTLGGVAG